MHIRGTPDVRTMTPLTTTSEAKSGSIEIAIRVIEQKTSVPADVAIKTLVDCIRHRAFDSRRAAVASEGAVAIALTRESFARNYGLANLAKTHVRAMLTQGSDAMPDLRVSHEEVRTREAFLSHAQKGTLKMLVETNEIPWQPWLNSEGQQVVCVMHAHRRMAATIALSKSGYGHWQEQASAAWGFLQECNLHGSPVEFFNLKGGNHCLVVIGRDPASNLEDRNTWGPDAVVCDPWADKVYPLSMFDEMRLPENNVQSVLRSDQTHYLTGTLEHVPEGRWVSL